MMQQFKVEKLKKKGKRRPKEMIRGKRRWFL